MAPSDNSAGAEGRGGGQGYTLYFSPLTPRELSFVGALQSQSAPRLGCRSGVKGQAEGVGVGREHTGAGA